MELEKKKILGLRRTIEEYQPSSRESLTINMSHETESRARDARSDEKVDSGMESDESEISFKRTK
jgi:hypothetical protein